jgi:hypothetical protein
MSVIVVMLTATLLWYGRQITQRVRRGRRMDRPPAPRPRIPAGDEQQPTARVVLDLRKPGPQDRWLRR